MKRITQQQIDFWSKKHFDFELQTNFDYVQFMKVLIAKERIKLSLLNDQSQHRDDPQD